MNPKELPSVYDQPQIKGRLAFIRLHLIRQGITQPKVRIGYAYQKPMNHVAVDQQWVQRFLLG